MNLELPYKLNTILERKENGKIYYDKVHHYIIDDNIYVILELSTFSDPRLSTPIPIEQLKANWTVYKTNH